MEHFKEGPEVAVVLVLTNNPQAMVLQRAKKFHIPARVFSKVGFRETGEVLRWLKESEVTHIVLAGFLWLVPMDMLKAYSNKIINIHPSLLPKYGGKGMYGEKVHDAVKQSGDKETGITVHLVNERFDEGKILFQAHCPIVPVDSIDQIAAKVHGLEHAHYPQIIEQWIRGAKI